MLATEPNAVANSNPETQLPAADQLAWKEIVAPAEPFLKEVAERLKEQIHAFERDIAVYAEYALTNQGKQLRPVLVALSGGAAGKVTDAHYTADGLEFTFHPQCLPLPVPEPARIGAGLIPLGHRLSYEAIYLHGLPAGNYGLSIDDTPIGTYAAATLESKLELESIETTPEYRQAVEVMELNARRNTEAVLPLRDLWRAQKTLTRTRGELAAAPSDEALKKRITAYERKLSNFEEQIATWETKARELEEQIYEANRPRPLRFRLIRRAD